MQTLTSGISPCPNDVFLFAGIILGTIDTNELRFSFDYQDVETLNARSRTKGYDVVKISYANALAIENDYELLDCGGALGRGVGPLLLRNGEGTFDPKQEVLVPGEHTTANFLLDFYAGAGLQKRYVPFDALYEELLHNPRAQGVVIHEKRFTYQRDGLTLVQDLGEHWESRTGFAIPLGAIAVRRSLGMKERVESLIRASLDWSYAHEAEALDLCRQYAQEMSDDVMRSHIELYVNDYSRDLGEEGKAAVAFFQQKQVEFAMDRGISRLLA